MGYRRHWHWEVAACKILRRCALKSLTCCRLGQEFWMRPFALLVLACGVPACRCDPCARLRKGLTEIQQATRAQLVSSGFLTGIVRTVGVWLPRSELVRMYGAEAAHAVNGEKGVPGLFQIPQQLECALVHLSNAKPIRKHLTDARAAARRDGPRNAHIPETLQPGLAKRAR